MAICANRGDQRPHGCAPDGLVNPGYVAPGTAAPSAVIASSGALRKQRQASERLRRGRA
jgi:hypothetical protein